MSYDIYPAVDDSYNFPPEVRGALAKSQELRNTVVPMTTAQRNNLAGADLWDGRLILNTTTSRINRYSAATGSWYTSAEQSDAILYYTQAQRDNLSGTDLYANRLILNTTTRRINRYDLPTTSWVAVVEPADLKNVLTSTLVPSSNVGSGSIGVSPEGARADHSHPAAAAAKQSTIFTASGTWTKPAGAVSIEVKVISAGGGGAYANGTTSNPGGGNGGNSIDYVLDAATLPATVPVTVGAGGLGATASNTSGQDGGASSFGSYVVSPGGKGGSFQGSISGTPLVNPASYSDHQGGQGAIAYSGITYTASKAQNSVDGGAGGGANLSNSAIYVAGGTSIAAGNGGSANATMAAADGLAPAGGGAGINPASSSVTRGGNGARGEVRIYVTF